LVGNTYLEPSQIKTVKTNTYTGILINTKTVCARGSNIQKVWIPRYKRKDIRSDEIKDDPTKTETPIADSSLPPDQVKALPYTELISFISKKAR
jgi:hypothetical protein